ncbi:phosphatidic acid phosphatase beta [Ilyonectria robusta]
MGFFNRNRETTTRDHRLAGKSHSRHHEPYSMSTRPTFGQWLKHTWLDILTMAIMGAIGLGVSHASHQTSLNQC